MSEKNEKNVQRGQGRPEPLSVSRTRPAGGGARFDTLESRE